MNLYRSLHSYIAIEWLCTQDGAYCRASFRPFLPLPASLPLISHPFYSLDDLTGGGRLSDLYSNIPAGLFGVDLSAALTANQAEAHKKTVPAAAYEQSFFSIIFV